MDGLCGCFIFIRYRPEYVFTELEMRLEFSLKGCELNTVDLKPQELTLNDVSNGTNT